MNTPNRLRSLMVIVPALCLCVQLSAQVRYADSVIAFSSQYDTAGWSAKQILGPPDIYPSYGDNRKTWAQESPDDNREWIELYYLNPAPVQSVAIYETFNPGAVDTVYVRNPGTGQWQVVWSGTAAPLAFPDSRIFLINFPRTPFNVSELRLAINSPVVPGWNEYDAVAISSTAIALNLPDLAVTQVQAPAEAWSGQNITVSWTVRNIGSSSTRDLRWVDRMYLSATAALDAASAALTSDQDNVTSLAPGQSYAGSATFKVPEGLSGDYYVFVYADPNHAVAESLKTNNLGRTAVPVLLHLSSAPDLMVSSLTAPTIVFAGDTVNVSYAVKNIGRVATPLGVSWTDQFFLSKDTVLVVSGAVGLVSITHDGILQPDSSYRVTMRLAIPHDLSGHYYLYVFADRENQVFENNIESNNIRRSDAISIVSVPPDLVLTSVSAPSTAGSGQSIQVSWSVKNRGAGSTVESSWSDRVYLSTLPDFDAGEATWLADFPHEGALAPDSAYYSLQSLVLPNGISGSYYVYVKADCNNNVFELSAETNRIRRSASPISISLSPWPDLRVVALQVPSVAKAGQSMTLTWSVKNTGAASTPEIIWNDKIYISSDSTMNGSAVFLAEVPHSSPLAPGATYTQSATVTIPASALGEMYFYVWSDGDNVIYEPLEESTKLRRSTAVSVQPYPPIDLAVTDFIVPDSAISGEPVTIGWTVKNIGSGRTLSEEWDDALYLSARPVFNADSAISIDRVTHESALEPAAKYSRSLPFTVPSGISGRYYWVVVADVQHGTGDTALGNNIRISAKPVFIKLLPRPDLVVTSIKMDDSVFAGQPAMVRWTVRNSSAGPVNSGDWYDAVYLSSVAQLDKSATKLESHSHSGALQPMESYTDSVEVAIPLNIAGSNYMLVQADSRDDIAESNENNNVGATSSVLRLAAPCDLLVTDVSFPDSAQPGDWLTVSYNLSNQGINRALGYLTDAVYVSLDPNWDGTDPLIGTSEHYVDLPPAGVQHKVVRLKCAAMRSGDLSGSVEGELPGIRPGRYHVIVRTDIHENIPETDKGNNLFVSSLFLNVSVPVLQRNTVQNSFIKQDQSKYFSFTTAAGEDVSVTLQGGSASGFNELFVRYGDLPSRGKYDYVYQNQNSPNQQVTVSSAQAGTQYVLVRGENVEDDSSAFSIVVRTLQFKIDSVRYSRGGAGGEVTMEILGAKFQPGAMARLQRTGYPSVYDNSDCRINSTQLNARFSTTGMSLGVYDVVVVNPDGQEAILHNGFTLEQGDPNQLLIAFAGSNRMRINSVVPLYIVATNPTNINVQRALIFFKVRREMRFWVETDQSLFGTPGPGTWSADSLVDDEGNRTFSVYLYNLAPKRTKTIRLLVEPTVIGRYIFMADAVVLDRMMFDSLLVVAVREGVRQRWLPPAGSEGSTGSSTISSLMKTAGGCPYDDAGACDAWNDRQRMQDIAQDAQSVVTAGAEASTVTSPGPGGLWKLGKFFKGLNDFFNKYKNSSGYAGDGVAALDPNDLVGPSGFGDQRWVSVSQTLQYTIRYENDPSKANAPAQTVSITMNLDSTLDAGSFRLMNFGFGGWTFTGAIGRSYYAERLDCRDSLGVYVDVTAGVDVEQHKVFWSFKSVDPNTGDVPTNLMVGMLPVNDALHHGEGFVSYTIRPRSTSRTGDRISPKARIVFDINEPIDTPPLFNTIDAGLPTSTVQTLPSEMKGGTITVRWTARDDSAGSGIGNYSIYVSKNDSAFVPWLTNVSDTSAPFTGVTGARYSFFSVATDHAGNGEPMKTKGEASVLLTGIPGHQEQLPKEYALEQNYPNPFNPSTTIRFALKEISRVKIDIFNVLGQRVMKFDLGEMRPGLYSQVVDMSRYASGIYLYRIDAVGTKGGRFISVKKMVLIK